MQTFDEVVRLYWHPLKTKCWYSSRCFIAIWIELRKRWGLTESKDGLNQVSGLAIYRCVLFRLRCPIADTNTAYDGNDGDAITSCKAGSDFTWAETWVPPNKFVEAYPQDRYLPTPSQITVCPWFVEWAVNEEYQVSSASASWLYSADRWLYI